MSIPDDLEYEIIVVDNNSSDRTSQVVEDFRAPCGCIRYIFEGKQGKSFAMNTGILSTKAEWIAFVDDDVSVDRNWLRNLREAINSLKCDAIQGRILLRFEEPLPKWFSAPLMKALAHVDYGDASRDVYELVGANVAFKASVFERFGSFNTALGPGASGFNEDVEFSRRIRSKGAILIYCPDVLVHHIIPSERLTKSYFRERYYRQGRCDAYMAQEKGAAYSLLSVMKGTAMALMGYCRKRSFESECLFSTNAGNLAQVLSNTFSRGNRR